MQKLAEPAYTDRKQTIIDDQAGTISSFLYEIERLEKIIKELKGGDPVYKRTTTPL